MDVDVSIDAATAADPTMASAAIAAADAADAAGIRDPMAAPDAIPHFGMVIRQDTVLGLTQVLKLLPIVPAAILPIAAAVKKLPGTVPDQPAADAAPAVR